MQQRLEKRHSTVTTSFHAHVTIALHFINKYHHASAQCSAKSTCCQVPISRLRSVSIFGEIEKAIQVLRKKFNALPKSRQNMNSLFNQIRQIAKNFPKETILPHIRKLPSVLKAIIEKNGGRTKY